ncbi:hypothetical protein AVEN_238052-1 [Araneus ventricosus]|uniref:Uncharacterized protein n=1 Tax=Araneus ventricosus TaxID=182803 RepID=A0A4Y2FE26_ARAVE|nr:hypothetical protein AVEN_238052-1 [Araneus ventricosus]
MRGPPAQDPITPKGYGVYVATKRVENLPSCVKRPGVASVNWLQSFQDPIPPKTHHVYSFGASYTSHHISNAGVGWKLQVAANFQIKVM